jgi:transcriptional regulator with XRE-family HTH domain
MSINLRNGLGNLEKQLTRGRNGSGAAESGSGVHPAGAVVVVVSSSKLFLSRPSDQRTLGLNIQACRKQLGLSRAEFGAKFGGYKDYNIRRYENGSVLAPTTLLLNLIRHGCHPSVLFANIQQSTDETLVSDNILKLARQAQRLKTEIDNQIRSFRQQHATAAAIDQIAKELKDAFKDLKTIRDTLARHHLKQSNNDT